MPRLTREEITVVKTYKADVWGKTGGMCWYCGKLMNPFKTFSVDHFIPITHGGSSILANLVPTCRPCNSAKRNRTLEEFRRLCQKKQGQIFTGQQLEYLKTVGVALPEPPPFIFYFEQVHLSVGDQGL